MQPQLVNPCAQVEFPGRTVAYTGTAGNTTAWKPGPELVMVFSTTAAYIEVGVEAVATTGSTPIPANTPVLIKLPINTSGAPWRVSAIQVASGGDVYAKPCNRN